MFCILRVDDSETVLLVNSPIDRLVHKVAYQEQDLIPIECNN